MFSHPCKKYCSLSSCHFSLQVTFLVIVIVFDKLSIEVNISSITFLALLVNKQYQICLFPPFSQSFIISECQISHNTSLFQNQRNVPDGFDFHLGFYNMYNYCLMKFSYGYQSIIIYGFFWFEEIKMKSI